MQIFGGFSFASWMYYLTKDMAKAVDLKGAPYKNLKEYREYKKFTK